MWSLSFVLLRTQPRVQMAQVLGSVGHSSRVRQITQEGEQSEKTELALEMSASLCEKSPGLAVPLSAGAARRARCPSQCWSSQESDCGEEG